ncbi:MAG: UMP kinase [Nanoarchaeota archaeon]
MKKMIVLSLGGSLIIPDKIDVNFLKKFKKLILQNTKNHKFIIVCGGGSLARKYIFALKATGANEKLQSLSGISATRTNARFMSYFFNKDPGFGIPHTIETLNKYVKKHDIVFCGALEYRPEQTSDSTAAKIAAHFKTIFINLTNVNGLYDKNPLENKDARFIAKISWKELWKMANKLQYKPGQHFVIDQTASRIIMQHKIPTYVLGKDLKQLRNVLRGKKFSGTLISD